jgi:hypothetical protein
MSRSQELCEQYMCALDSMTDAEGVRFSFAPRALEEAGVQFADLWRQHTVARGQSGAYSYEFEI